MPVQVKCGWAPLRILTTSRIAASRSAAAPRAPRRRSRIDAETGGGTAIGRRAASASVGAAEHDAHPDGRFDEIDVDALVAELHVARVHPESRPRPAEEADAGADVVREDDGVPHQLGIAHETEAADVDQADTDGAETHDLVAPVHGDVVDVVDLPAEEIDVQVEPLTVFGRGAEEAEFDLVVPGPVVAESETEIPG